VIALAENVMRFVAEWHAAAWETAGTAGPSLRLPEAERILLAAGELTAADYSRHVDITGAAADVLGHLQTFVGTADSTWTRGRTTVKTALVQYFMRRAQLL